MKKLLAVVIALVLACGMLSAFAEDDFLGVWYLIQLKMGDMEIDPASMGISIAVTFNEDGTGTAATTQGDQTASSDFVWENRDGQLLMITPGAEGPQEGPVSFADGLMVISSSDGDMILSREAPEAVVKAVPVPAESEEAFFGTWALSQIVMEGQIISAELLAAMEVSITCPTVIEAGKATLGLNFMGIDATVEGTTEFVDGVLLVAVEDSEPVVIQLLDDGGLYVVLTSMSMQMPVYLVPAAAEEAPAA